MYYEQELSALSYTQCTAASRAHGGAILLIEDDLGMQRALQRILQRSGHDITSVVNGLEGLEALGERPYEVILCDMRMPDMDGLGFYRVLARRHPSLLSRLVFLTGDVLSPEVQDFLARVDRPCLFKPFTALQVRQVIRQVREGTRN